MEWWDKVMQPVRSVCNGVALRLGLRRGGLPKLRHDVRACQYQDVHVMWEMLKRNQTENARISEKSKKIPFWNSFGWARCTPYFCTSY